MSIGSPDFLGSPPITGPPLQRAGPITGTNTWYSGMLNVQNWDRLGLLLGGQESTCMVSIIWYSDQQATYQLGQRTFVLKGNIQQITPFNLRNQGPWVQVELSQPDANFTKQTFLAFGSNTRDPSECQAVNPLVLVNDINVPANGQVALWPGFYYEGPLQLWLDYTQAGYFQMQMWNSSDQGVTIIQGVTTTSGQEYFDNWYSPLGAWQFVVTNSSAAVWEAKMTLLAAPAISL